MTRYKLSTHARFVIGAVIIAFVGSFFTQPVIVHWISTHPVISDLLTSAGVAYHAYCTYSQPKTLG